MHPRILLGVFDDSQSARMNKTGENEQKKRIAYIGKVTQDLHPLLDTELGTAQATLMIEFKSSD